MLDVSANAGVTQVWSIGGAAKTMTAAVAQTVGFANESTGGKSVATFTSVTGGSDAATVAVNNAGKTTAYTSITVAGIETLTVNATGVNKLGDLAAAQATTLKVVGTGSVNAVGTTGTFKTVDASTHTGGLTLDISGVAAADHTITTGSGNDEITIDSVNLTKLDTINLKTSVAQVQTGDNSGRLWFCSDWREAPDG